jgi:ferredoxin-NADP reductase
MKSPRLLKASLRPRSYGAIFIVTALGSFWHYYTQSHSEQKLRYLNPSNFTPYTLVSKDAVSSTSSIFRLRPQNKDSATSRAVKEAFKKGIWSVQFKQPQLQIARNYTPLPDPDESLDDDELHVLVRREKSGEVSNYLHDLPERSTIAIRGPFNECEIPSDVMTVLFLAGGTGIAPALQVASLLRDRSNMKMHILWANRRREDCEGGQSSSIAPESGQHLWFRAIKTATQRSLPDSRAKTARTVQLLESLKSQIKSDQLHVDYFVDEEKTFIKPTDVSRLLEQSPRGRSLVLISGPDGFMEYWAGQKEWAMGREIQGALRGQLAKMDRKGWAVVKI